MGEKSQVWEGGQRELTLGVFYPHIYLTAQPGQDDDPPPSTLLKDYQNVPGIEK